MMLFRLLLRQIQNAKRFTFIFCLNLTLGLVGFVFLQTFKVGLDKTMAINAKKILTADLLISGRRKPVEVEQGQIDIALSDAQRNNKVTLYSMAVAKESNFSRLVMINAIEKGFPLYGDIRSDQESLRDNGIEAGKTWVSKELAFQFGLKIGSAISLGKKEFFVSNIITEDSTASMTAIGFAPKLFISKNDIDATKLINYGSLATYTQYYKFQDTTPAEKISDISKSLKKIITDKAISVRSQERSGGQVNRVTGYLLDFLGLVSLVALFLSTLGASYLFQTYVLKKKEELAIMKILGMKLGRLRLFYSLHLSILGFLCASASLVISYLTYPILLKILKGYMKINFVSAFDWQTIFVAYAVAIFVVQLVCLPLINRFIKTPPQRLFSPEENEAKKSLNLKAILTYIPFGLGMYAIAVWQSHSFIIGSFFTSVILISMILILLIFPYLLNHLGILIRKNSTTLLKPINLYFSLGIRYLVRSRFSSTLCFISISIGVLLFTLIGQLEYGLQTQLIDNKSEKPSLFLFDIQPEQVGPLRKYAKDNSVPLKALTPMVRARILKLNAVAFQKPQGDEEGFQTREQQTEQRFRNRGVNLTYQKSLNSSEEIIRGVPFTSDINPELAQISLEQRYAKRINASLGDILTFDILGVEVKGKVVNLRSVKWTSFLPNFFITFQPGFLEDAPQTTLAAVGNTSFETQQQIQKDIVLSFSNISIINVGDLVKKIMTLFSALALAIKAMALLCGIVGIVVIFAIVQDQLSHRKYEISLLKIQGLSRKSLTRIYLNEFLSLSILAVLVGNVFSFAVSWLIANYFFDGISAVNYYFLPISILLISLIVTSVVTFAVYDSYKKPIGNLLE